MNNNQELASYHLEKAMKYAAKSGIEALQAFTAERPSCSQIVVIDNGKSNVDIAFLENGIDDGAHINLPSNLWLALLNIIRLVGYDFFEDKDDYISKIFIEKKALVEISNIIDNGHLI